MRVSAPLVLGLAAAIGLYALKTCYVSPLEPPPSVVTFDDYLAWRSDATEFVRITKRGREFIQAKGPESGVLASGPSGYVFDSAGRMVDWSFDTGDDPEFVGRWYSSSHRRGIPRHKALELVRKWQKAC